MRTRYSDGKLWFDASEFLDALPADEKVEFVETLACDDAVIKHVADQLLDGWTESGMHGGVLCSASADPQEGNVLDFQRRRIARGAGEVAAKEIKRLEEALAHEREKYLKTCTENMELRNALNRYR